MDIISGIFGEAEFRVMPDEMINCLGRLLDDKLAVRIKTYLLNPQADQEIVERIKSLIGDKIERCTFHEDVLQRGLVDLVSKLSVPTLAYTEVDLPFLETELSWLKQNKDKLKSYIEPRKRDDFQEFLYHIRELQRNMIGKPKEYTNLVDRVMANKNSFCAANEKPRPTRIGTIVSQSQNWEIGLNGVRFLLYCQRNSIEDWLRREF